MRVMKLVSAEKTMMPTTQGARIIVLEKNFYPSPNETHFGVYKLVYHNAKAQSATNSHEKEVRHIYILGLRQ